MSGMGNTYNDHFKDKADALAKIEALNLPVEAVDHGMEEGPMDWREVPCKEWRGSTNGHGYGERRIGKKKCYVHRLAWEKENGPIPDGLEVCHKCDKPACYEVAHLFLGTHSQNMVDCVEKGRHFQKSKTHCAHGHEFTQENTRIENGGARVCRTCERERSAKYGKTDRGRETSRRRQSRHTTVSGGVVER